MLSSRRSPAQSTTPRPSLFRHAPLLILALIVLGDIWQTTDPDLWGHIRFGQLMLSSGHVVSHDIYSYSAPGSTWRDHEYLAEITMALVYNRTGLRGLKVWKFLCVAAMVLMMATALAETQARFAIQLNVLAIAVAAISPHMQFRPQLYSYNLLALILLLLARHNYRGQAPLWWIIPGMALWANLHGGFIVGIAVMLAYSAAVAACDVAYGRSLRRGMYLGRIAFAGTLATLFTPYGLGTWRAVLKTLWSPLTFRIFADWQPFAVAMREQWRFNHYGIVVYLCLLALWAVLLTCVILRPSGGDFALLMVAAIISAGALVSVRNVPLAAIACVVPTARHLDLVLRQGIERSRRTPASARIPQWLVAAAALLSAGPIFSARLPTDMAYPSAAVSFMKEHRLRGNVLGDFGWGEYLIWHLSPQSKVFLDSRYDMAYPLSVVRDYIAFYYDRSGAETVLHAYSHDLVLIPPHAAACMLMARSRGWKMIYRDRNAVLFARDVTAYASLTRRQQLGASPIVQYFP
jgi:hypothetical protein